jgi:hydantoinase/carbamoylase family amidase
VHALNTENKRLPFAVEVIGFGDEEGVRFGTTLLGSRGVAGTFDAKVLAIPGFVEAMRDFGLDPARIAQAAKKKNEVLAYAELHIEQGPVLEAEGLPVGVVTAINGFSRLRCVLHGEAGHAGTVPMRLRRDALAGAAECALAVERIGRSDPELVATVGRIEALPGAINVIPGEVAFTVDVRAPRDELREGAVQSILAAFENIRGDRKLGMQVENLQSQGVAACAPWLMAQMEKAVAAEGVRVLRLPSGAGHDGQAMQAIAGIGMLFVRCKAGISHNPAEAITEADAACGARVLERFIRDFAPAC